MRPGKPLARRTRLTSRKPLANGRPLARKTPLREVSLKREASSGRPGRPRDTGPVRTTRDLVMERDDFRCVVCGRSIFAVPEWSIHHRRNRGAGGSSDPRINAPSNLLLVCGSGTTLCHGDLTDNTQRDAALTAGWVVSLNSKQDPADVPVLHAQYGPVLLDDAGGVTLLGRAA